MFNKLRIGKPEVVFTIFRYITLILQVIKVLVLAKFLGPFFLGVYGYITLYQQYLSYSNLGIQYSLNTELSLYRNQNDANISRVIGASFSLTFFVCLIIILIGFICVLFKISIFPYPDSYKYIFFLVISTSLIHFQQLYTNIFRVYRILTPIIITEFIIAISALIVAPFFKGESLLTAVLTAWIISLIAGVLFYSYKIPLKVRFSIDKQDFKLLIKQGLPLLIYVFSYYLISLISRSLIAFFYSTEIMGLFSFANNITLGIMLGLDTITWLIFPTVISQFGNTEMSNDEIMKNMEILSRNFNIITFSILFFAIITSPLIFYFLPQYLPIKNCLAILLLTQGVFNSTFSMVTLYIARKKQLRIAFFSIISVLICGSIGLVFSYLKLNFIWIPVSTFLGVLLFVNIVFRFGAKDFKLTYKRIISNFGWKVQLIICLSVLSILCNNIYGLILTVLLFVCIQWSNYKSLLLFVKTKVSL